MSVQMRSRLVFTSCLDFEHTFRRTPFTTYAVMLSSIPLRYHSLFALGRAFHQFTSDSSLARRPNHTYPRTQKHARRHHHEGAFAFMSRNHTSIYIPSCQVSARAVIMSVLAVSERRKRDVVYVYAQCFQALVERFCWLDHCFWIAGAFGISDLGDCYILINTILCYCSA